MNLDFYHFKKRIFRIRLFTLLILAILPTLLSAEGGKGYLVTRNGVWLTGTISAIFDENQIIFVNDFGTPYQIHAFLILGYVVNNEEGDKDLYVSKYSGNKWRFMKMLYQGENVGLYTANVEYKPMIRPEAVQDYRFTKSIFKDEYFIEFRAGYPVLITRAKFKKIMKRLLKKRAPELSNKIGKKGYRYKDMLKILKEFNMIMGDSSYKM